MEKICKFCGNTINEGDKFCQGCGASVESAVAKQEVINEAQNNVNTNQYNETNNNAGKTNPSAIAGFVCSLVGLVILPIYLGILAICLGVAAKKHIKIFKNEKGNGLATAAIVIGIVDIVLQVIFSILGEVITSVL